MKNFVLGVLVIFIGFFSSVIVVNQSEYAIVTYPWSKEITVDGLGVNFIIPFINNISYVSINAHQFKFIIDKDKLRFDIVATWHINHPQQYWIKTKAGEYIAFERYMQSVVKDVLDANLANLSDINQQINLGELSLNNNDSLNSFGIKLDKVMVINVTPLNNPLVLNDESHPVIAITSEAIESSSTSVAAAYLKANDLKTQAQIEVANIYSTIESTNPKFYRYFRTLEAYKASLTDKSKLPPLNQLYK